MTESQRPPADPTRDQVAALWEKVIAGEEARETAHAFARQWVGVEDADVADPMVDGALLHLHGFTMVEADEAADRTNYTHTIEDIAAAYERWRTDCAKFDEDPVAFIAEKRRLVAEYLAREKRNESDE